MTSDQAVLAELAAVRIELARLCASHAEVVAAINPTLTRAQVAKRIGKSPNTIDRWVLQRAFPRPIARGVWALADVMAWEARNAQFNHEAAA